MRLITISLIISLIGIFILFVLSFFIAPAEVSSASQLQLNNYVSAQGTIKQIKTYDDFSVIKLDNNITITCSCNFSINKSIQVTGKVAEYRGELQIRGDKIKEI